MAQGESPGSLQLLRSDRVVTLTLVVFFTGILHGLNAYLTIHACNYIIMRSTGKAPGTQAKGQATMFVPRPQLHDEVDSVLGLISTLTHGVVSVNSPDADDLMKSVLIEAAFKLDAILALEEAIAAAFEDIDPTDF